MAKRDTILINLLRIRLALAFIILVFTASCVSIDCDYNTRIRPDPISLSVEEGVFYGQNYEACFLIDGVIHKEYIPECAYKYYYDKQNQSQFGR
ncbi:MAG: hypothetical protein H6Q52_452 [Deltaproteobacteria bacterium]|nr:hypothetical protein [Deltaproteobacteria bacterium]